MITASVALLALAQVPQQSASEQNRVTSGYDVWSLSYKSYTSAMDYRLVLHGSDGKPSRKIDLLDAKGRSYWGFDYDRFAEKLLVGVTDPKGHRVLYIDPESGAVDRKIELPSFAQTAYSWLAANRAGHVLVAQCGMPEEMLVESLPESAPAAPVDPNEGFSYAIEFSAEGEETWRFELGIVGYVSCLSLAGETLCAVTADHALAGITRAGDFEPKLERAKVAAHGDLSLGIMQCLETKRNHVALFLDEKAETYKVVRLPRSTNQASPHAEPWVYKHECLINVRAYDEGPILLEPG